MQGPQSGIALTSRRLQDGLLSLAGSAARPVPSQRSWQRLGRGCWFLLLLATAALLAAAPLLLRTPRFRRAVRPRPDPSAPCTMAHLNGLVDGDVQWESWTGLHHSSSSGGVLPAWRPPWLATTRCRLRRFEAADARRCLARRPLVMIGDSVTRWVGVATGWLEAGGPTPAAALRRVLLPDPAAQAPIPLPLSCCVPPPLADTSSSPSSTFSTRGAGRRRGWAARGTPRRSSSASGAAGTRFTRVSKGQRCLLCIIGRGPLQTVRC